VIDDKPEHKSRGYEIMGTVVDFIIMINYTYYYAVLSDQSSFFCCRRSDVWRSSAHVWSSIAGAGLCSMLTGLELEPFRPFLRPPPPPPPPSRFLNVCGDCSTSVYSRIKFATWNACNETIKILLFSIIIRGRGDFTKTRKMP